MMQSQYVLGLLVDQVLIRLLRLSSLRTESALNEKCQSHPYSFAHGIARVKVPLDS